MIKTEFFTIYPHLYAIYDIYTFYFNDCFLIIFNVFLLKNVTQLYILLTFFATINQFRIKIDRPGEYME